MDPAELNQLIEQLKHLQVRRENISAEERRIVQRISNSIGDSNNSSEPQSQPAIVETDVVRSAEQVTAPPTLHIGDHVYITNLITHTAPRRPTNADRASIVTGFTSAGRVAIETYNGYRTNRLPKNLRKITAEEKIAYLAERRR
jgi:hypothetical protein